MQGSGLAHQVRSLLWVFHVFVCTSSLHFSARLRRLWRSTAVGTQTWSTWWAQSAGAQACLWPCGWFFPALCWCVPLNAVLGPLWTNLLRSAYWVRENEAVKQLLVEDLCSKVLCAKAMGFAGKLCNILAMKIQIVCCCFWHNQIYVKFFTDLTLSSLETLNILHCQSCMLCNPRVIVAWSSHKHCCLAICGRGKLSILGYLFCHV